MSALCAEQRLISVVGEAQKSFQPDIVYINLSLWGKGDSAKKAQNNNQSQYDILKKSLETFKVKAEDVKTTSYSLNPEYNFDPKTNKNNINGYSATQDLQVKLRKIEDAGPFIDSLMTSSKAMTSGVNVNSLGFDLEKREEESRALLGKAVEAAQKQAEALAKAADVKLKGLFRLAPVTDGQAPVPVYRKQMAIMATDGGPTQMMSGEVKVEASVAADYMIE